LSVTSNDTVIKFLKSLIFRNGFQNFGYLPRWIIFAIDIFIVFIASIVTDFIIFKLTDRPFDNLNMTLRYGIVLVVNAAFFLFYRTYSGIIRHSTFIDGVKLLVSTSTAYVALLVINYGGSWLMEHEIFVTTSLFISYVNSFLMLFLFRIMVKYMFERYLNTEDHKLTNAVIYGVDANAISVANALRTAKPSRFKLLGFIDKFSYNKAGKSILNLPILNQNKSIHVILRAMKADALIIAEKSLSKEETISIVEECLEYGFKVFTVPLISDWEDQTQISNKVKSFEIDGPAGSQAHHTRHPDDFFAAQWQSYLDYGCRGLNR
jgi:FlaA1/EpsC-like NDP-sugar epimerase